MKQYLNFAYNVLAIFVDSTFEAKCKFSGTVGCQYSKQAG